jgi:hypothetical protein
MWSRELEWLLAAGGQAGETIVGYYGRVSCVLPYFFLCGAGRCCGWDGKYFACWAVLSIYLSGILSSYHDRCVGYERDGSRRDSRLESLLEGIVEMYR